MRTRSSKRSPFIGLCLMGQALAGCADKAAPPSETSASTSTAGAAGTTSTKPATASSTATPSTAGSEAKPTAKPSSGAAGSTEHAAAQSGGSASQAGSSAGAAAGSGGAGGSGGVASAAGSSGSAGGSASDGSDPAVMAARAAMRKAEYAQIPELVMKLDASATAHPDDAEVALYAAAIRLWRLSDAANDKKFDLLQQAVVLNEALMRFDAAKKLNPDDGRIDAWVAILNLNYGTALDDADQIAKAVRMLEEAVPKYPSFGTFVRGVGLAELPRTDPNFQHALDAMLKIFDECGVKFDLDHPELDPTKLKSEGLCGEVEVAPHNLEGVLLNMGDVALKAGKADAARKIFMSIRTAPGFQKWRYASLLDQRITDADTLSQRYTDDDPMNDPVLTSKSGMFCAGCHAD